MIKRIYYAILQRLYTCMQAHKLDRGDMLPKIYMLHNIEEKRCEYSISKKEFGDLISYLYNNKRIVEIKDIKQQNATCLTFDDVSDSFYYGAYPILKKYDVPYYLFVCNELLNLDGYLSENMIKEILNDSKCVIGSHSYYHDLSRKYKENDFKELLMKSKRELEEKFNIEINDFAFPYGSFYAFSKKNSKVASEIFENIFSTIDLPYKNKIYNTIPRININYKTYQKEMTK